MALRVAIVLALFAVVAADAEPDNGLESAVSAFMGEERRLEGCKDMKKQMREAHMCHRNCGGDGDCHRNCPKPWKPLIEACRLAPKKEQCYLSCKSQTSESFDACHQRCPVFATEWIQKKFEADPERTIEKGHKICPMLEKVHECHKQCSHGDHECHHSCPRMFGHGGHHGQHNWHGKHNWHHDKHHHAQKGAFVIKGFEALEMWPTQAPSDRFNGRFVPTGKVVNGRQVFVQRPTQKFMGKQRTIAWLNGYWRYYSFYDETSQPEAGLTEKCTFMVKSDAKHPAKIYPGEHWVVHESALRYVTASGFSKTSPIVEVEMEVEGQPKDSREEPMQIQQKALHVPAQAPSGNEKTEEGGKNMKKQMREAHMCHRMCGGDGNCHKNCPKPWKPLMEACRLAPQIEQCYLSCKSQTSESFDTCHQRCPVFATEWIQKRFEADPERAIEKGHKICPMLVKVHECHKQCSHGDFECHRSCPRMFGHGGHRGKHDHAQKGAFLPKDSREEHMQIQQKALHVPAQAPSVYEWPVMQKAEQVDVHSVLTFLYDKFKAMVSDFSDLKEIVV